MKSVTRNENFEDSGVERRPLRPLDVKGTFRGGIESTEMLPWEPDEERSQTRRKDQCCVEMRYFNTPGMVTKEQYEFFRRTYEDGMTVYSALENRAKLYLTIHTLYLGAFAFKTEDVLRFASAFSVPVVVPIFIGLLLVTGLLLTILATRIRVYERPTDTKMAMEAIIGPNGQDEEEFFTQRIIDYSTASEWNTKQNNKVGEMLVWAGILLFSAVFLHAVASFIAFWNQVHPR